MLFFSRGQAPTLRRSRHNPGSWLSADSPNDADSAMREAGAALRHAGADIAEAARQIGTEASHQVRANAAAASEDIADAARQIGADASRQVRHNAAAVRKEAERQIRRNAAAARKEAERQVRRNAAAARAEAKRQIRHNVKAVRATASAVPDDLLPAGLDAIRKSVERVGSGRRKREHRGPLSSALVVLAATGLALIGVQMLMARRSSRSMRRRDWGRGPEGRTTGAVGVSGTTGIESLGSAGSARTADAGATAGPAGSARTAGLSAAATTGLPKPASLSKPMSSSRQTGPAGQHPAADLPADASTEAGTFDRDAGIRAGTEGMEPPEPLVPGAPRSETADGM